MLIFATAFLLLFADQGVQQLPFDVQKAMDALFFPQTYSINLIFKSSDSERVPDAQTFYMRNARGEEFVISEVPFEPGGVRTAKRAMSKEGKLLSSCAVAPVFQMLPVEPFQATWTSHSFPGPCAMSGGIPLEHQFRLNKPITAEQIRSVEVEQSDGVTETYRIATSITHFSHQTTNSVLRFKYDMATKRIIATNIQYGDRPNSLWYHLEYDGGGRIRKIRTEGAAGQTSWEITDFKTDGIPETLDWEWIGLVPGCNVLAPPGHPAANSRARWIGNDVVLPDEYDELAAAGAVSTHPEYWRAMYESMELPHGKADLTFQKGMAIFHLMYEQSRQGVRDTPWESIVREFGGAMSFTDSQYERAARTLAKATDRLREIAKVYDPEHPERAMFMLMCISQTSEGDDTHARQFECTAKARDLFLKFWDELKKEHVSRPEIEEWNARFAVAEK